MQIALALVLTIVSACALDLGYLFQHDVAASLPPLSLRRPIASVRSLLVEPRWLTGSGLQVGGFVLYVVALALAPLSLVQATAAGGIGILAIMVSRIRHVALSRREQVGAAMSVLGLALLGVSLLSTHGEGSGATYVWVGIWLGASTAGAVLCIMAARTRDRARTGLGHRLRHPLCGRGRGDQDGRLRRAPERCLSRLPDRLLRRRNSGPPGGLPTWWRADDGRPLDAADERTPDRRGHGALPRTTPLRGDWRGSRRGVRSSRRRGSAPRRA